MRLSTLWSVDATLDDEGRSPIADELLEAWRHDLGSARFVRSSANFVYSFRRDGEPYFLRFAHDSERTRPGVEAETSLLAWLVREGIPVAAPVASDAGQTVGTSATDLGLFHAVVFRGEQGVQLEPGDLDESLTRTWGESLGRLHSALRTYTARSRPARLSVDDELLLVEAFASRLEPIRRELEHVRSALAGLPRDEVSYGLIHGDYQLDNLFWGNGELRAIDFDDCRYHWYAADVALALDDVLDESPAAGSWPLGPFLEAYRDACGVREEAPLALGSLRRACDLVRYVKVNRALDLSPEPGHPQWLRALDGKLRSHVASYERRIADSHP